MTAYPLLTGSLAVGGLRLRNRVMVTAHVTNSALAAREPDTGPLGPDPRQPDGLRVLLGATPLAWRDGQLGVRDGAGRELAIAADALVVTGYLAARDDLAEQLRDRVGSVRLVGDAAAPRQAFDAVADGHRAARDL